MDEFRSIMPYDLCALYTEEDDLYLKQFHKIRDMSGEFILYIPEEDNTEHVYMFVEHQWENPPTEKEYGELQLMGVGFIINAQYIEFSDAKVEYDMHYNINFDDCDVFQLNHKNIKYITKEEFLNAYNKLIEHVINNKDSLSKMFN
jgi:hypothetical protein